MLVRYTTIHSACTEHERTVVLFATTDILGDNVRLAEAANEVGMYMRQVFADPVTYTLIFELSRPSVTSR